MCVLRPWQRANGICHERAGQLQWRPGGERSGGEDSESRNRAMGGRERERERGNENYEHKIRDTVFGKDEVISDFQSRNVVWQMELLGFGITQLIKP